MMESFFWDNVLISCELDDSVEAIDACEAPWSDHKPESQLDVYGDVHLEFLNHQHRCLGECIVPGRCIDAEDWVDEFESVH